MSDGAAALLCIAAGLVGLMLDALAPHDNEALEEDIERGSTTILPEDR